MSSTVELKNFATQIRIEIVKCLRKRGFGHMGGSLSIADLLAVLYGDVMHVDPKNPKMEDRDYLVVSKGHAGPALQATLALKGFFPLEWMETMSEPGTRLPSHCDAIRTPGIDMSTGSLGMGLSNGAGLARAQKLKGIDRYTYVILGDGEINEGQVWEAAMYAPHYKLNNLIAFVDWNKRQVDGYCKDVMNMGDIQKKFEDFGWYACTVKGNDVEAIKAAIEKGKAESGDKPVMIVLDGIKGSGVPEYETMWLNHLINPLDYDVATKVIADLESQLV